MSAGTARGAARRLANRTKNRVTDSAEQVGAQMDLAESYAEDYVEGKFDTDTRVGRAAQTGTVLTVVTLGITILVGILIYSQIQTSLPSPSNSDLKNASDNSTGTFADAMELAPVIMIILLAAVVLAVVQRFR